MTLEALLALGEVMHEELGREYYETGAGLKSTPEFQAIYERHAAAAGDSALETARASGSAALFEWVVDIRIGRAVAPLEERQLVWEQATMLQVDNRSIRFLRAPIELANSADRTFRTALDGERSRVGAEGLNGLRQERFQLEHQMVESLGLGGYVAALSALTGIDLVGLGEDARTFLDSTADMYAQTLADLAKRRLGVSTDELVRADAAWLFRADGFDAVFSSDRLLATAAGQMAEMGLDHTVSGRVRFDTGEREGKQPRAFCVPVRVPDEVYLVLRPRGGHSDYRTFWHELGHAMHFANVDPELDFTARWLGDNSVTEGFAMLWDHLTLDRGWIQRYTDLSHDAARELVFELAVAELFLARRYAAKLLYELELHESDFQSVASLYAELLSDATLFRYTEDDFLLDVDPGFYAARYLRAWQLEALMSRTLVERYDIDWYRNARAGEAVRDLMSRGQADPAERIAESVLGTPLSFERVVGRVTESLA